MYSRFGSMVLRVADWHLAKERPQDAFGATFFDLRVKVKELKNKLATEAMGSLEKALVKDLKDAGYEVVSTAFALGQYRGSKFITSAKLSVKVGTEAKAKKLAGQLLKYSPKYNLKAFDPSTFVEVAMKTLDLKLNLDVTFYDTGAVSVGGVRFGETTNVARFLKSRAIEQHKEKYVEFGDNMKEATELVRLAREFVGFGEYVEIRSLPHGVQNAIKRVYGRRDIEIAEATSYSPSMATSGWEGNRGFLMIVDIGTGRIEESQLGSWGGSNPFESKPVDTDRNRYPIPNGKIILYGSTGGRGNFAHILVRPDDRSSLVAEAPQQGVDLTDDEKKALAAINGIKSGYRADEFRRQGLGDYSTANPLVKALEQKGLLKFMASGIQVTTAGRNMATKIRGW